MSVRKKECNPQSKTVLNLPLLTKSRGQVYLYCANNIYTPIIFLFSQNVAKYANMRPMGRLGTTLEVANAVLFLSSPEAGFCTGNILSVDGGYHIDTKLPN